jgi:AcrR family transcriptional regulator
MPDPDWSQSERRILEAALRVVARQGVRRLSMGDVGEAAAMSRTNVYRYFSTKSALVDALAAYEGQRFAEGLEKVVADCPDQPAQATAVIGYYAGYAADHPAGSVSEVDPGFVLSYMRESLATANETLRAHLEDSLADAPIVTAGVLDRDELIDVLLRLQATTWILPPKPGSSLARTMQWLLLGP